MQCKKNIKILFLIFQAHKKGIYWILSMRLFYQHTSRSITFLLPVKFRFVCFRVHYCFRGKKFRVTYIFRFSSFKGFDILTLIFNLKSQVYITAQKMMFSIKDLFSKFDQIRSFLQIWSHLRKKSLMENFIFCAVYNPCLILYLSNKRRI